MTQFLNITRREYKVMLDHRLFLDRKAAVLAFQNDLESSVRRFPKIDIAGAFKTSDRRSIAFLDTSDQTICLNHFVFRERRDVKAGSAEYTLKCRSPDRYVAAGANVAATREWTQNRKFEEDIAAPFVTRFSHSNTIEGPTRPETLADAAQIFPVLGKLRRDEEPCPNTLKLRTVNSWEAFERVLKGVTLSIRKTEAELALILWSDGQEGRPIVAEFSFRYRSKDEDYSPKVAHLAMSFFEDLQRMDWCMPVGRTKTQFVFGN